MLLWSQTQESIDISIRLPSNIYDEIVSCENNNFYFSCSSQSKNFQIEFDLDKSVEKVSYNKYDNRIAIILEKTEYEKWDFLTKVRGIYKNNIKIDWNKWNDEEDDDNSPQTHSGESEMNMDMMRQMMGGMNPMDSGMDMMRHMNNYGEEDDEEDGNVENDEEYDEEDDNVENGEEDGNVETGEKDGNI